MSDRAVRDIHDAVAHSADPVVASTRPAGTTSREMRRMVQDVFAKLRPDGVSVLELGCGTGVLGVPLASRASRYVGVDISPLVVDQLRKHLPTALIRCADVTRDDLDDLGLFDRVLVYASLHYVADAAEGERFVRTALRRLAPGGRALFGNLPLPAADLPHSRFQLAGAFAWAGIRRLGFVLGRRVRRAEPQAMPAGACIALTRQLVESWLSPVPGIRWEWAVPRLGTPLQRIRADLVIEKSE